MPRLCSSHPSGKFSNSALAICVFLPLVRFSAPGATCCTFILVSFFPYLKSRLRPNASPPSVIPGLVSQRRTSPMLQAEVDAVLALDQRPWKIFGMISWWIFFSLRCMP